MIQKPQKPPPSLGREASLASSGRDQAIRIPLKARWVLQMVAASLESRQEAKTERAGWLTSPAYIDRRLEKLVK